MSRVSAIVEDEEGEILARFFGAIEQFDSVVEEARCFVGEFCARANETIITLRIQK